MPALLSVHQLYKSYGKIAAVHDISFEIERGEVFGLLGSNGAGKTTTLECLVGLREADRGEIKICTFDIRKQVREFREKIGVVLQATALPAKITPREALRLFGSFYRVNEEAEVLLERFGLVAKADVKFDTLSGGQRQRLALALALINRPKIVFLDEPTAGLDPRARAELQTEIVRLKTAGCTVLLTTHQLEEAEQLCDHVAIIECGRVVAVGAPRDLIARFSDLQSVSLITEPLISPESLAALPGLQELRSDGRRMQFRTRDIIGTLNALTALLANHTLKLVELRVRKASLEDVFLNLTGGRHDETEARTK